VREAEPVITQICGLHRKLKKKHWEITSPVPSFASFQIQVTVLAPTALSLIVAFLHLLYNFKKH